MLETDEVDDDYFTPVAGTSLANIFGNVPKSKAETANESLKYVPPKPQTMVQKTNDQTKSTECIFACALIGHEWSSGTYTSKGKLGFAIMKIQKTGIHNIILYDYNKTTLSSTNVSKSLKITIRNNSYISYYDSLQKYWSIFGTVEEVQKISELLESLGVNVDYSKYNADKGPPEPNKTEIEVVDFKESYKQNRESDTDSSVNRKTKVSILNRMANMGQSVLPTRTQVAEDSSGSSDVNETEVLPKLVRHKPVKTLKKSVVETVLTNQHHLTEAHQIITAKAAPENNLSVYNADLLPRTSVFTRNDNELNMFMSEQRISNSELRININRVNDKVDSVLSKMNSLENRKDNTTDVSTDILLKLLTEYENKIKAYEDLFKSKGGDNKRVKEEESNLSNKIKEIDILSSKLSDLEKERSDNFIKISSLENELKLLQMNNAKEIQKQSSTETELYTKINCLENDLKMKSKEITEITKKKSTESVINDDSIQNKVKDIMNDTFQSISMNFENNEVYTGETIIRIVGTVIKKITIETLKEL